MGHLVLAVRPIMNNSNKTMAVQLNKLTKTLKALIAGTNSQLNTCTTKKKQSFQVQLDIITKKLDNLMTPKPDRAVAYNKPEKEEQRGLAQLSQGLKMNFCLK